MLLLTQAKTAGRWGVTQPPRSEMRELLSKIHPNPKRSSSWARQVHKTRAVLSDWLIFRLPRNLLETGRGGRGLGFKCRRNTTGNSFKRSCSSATRNS